MINLDDTIVAISTPPGEGAIGIVRLSGRNAVRIASGVFRSPKGKSLEDVPSHTVHYGVIVDPREEEIIDEVLVTVMRAPFTYTKEDVVEINCHGGMVPMRRVLELLITAGARIASPGEFTLRAFLNGRIDLSQAEAVADLIRAKTDRSRRLAMEQLRGTLSLRIQQLIDAVTEVTAHVEAYIDFPEEDIEPATMDEIRDSLMKVIEEIKRLSATYQEGRYFREGLAVAIVGRPNVGKSSLLNALLQTDRAIVTDIPGTTRDTIEEYLNLNGLPVRVIDTAGIRYSKDLVEAEGVRRTLQAVEKADLVLAVFDISRPFTDEDRLVIERLNGVKAVIVLNKTDLGHQLQESSLPDGFPVVKISARTGEGLDNLKETILSVALKETETFEGVMVTNLRHRQALQNAEEALQRALQGLSEDTPLEIVAVELRDALQSLGEITGEVTTEDILSRIFSQFCIGK